MNKKIIQRVVLSLIILAVGFLGMRMMISSKEAQKQQRPIKPGALVEVLLLESEDVPVVINTHGTIQPRKMVDIAAQVGGIVLNVPRKLVAGGYFQKGDLLFEIDPVDYELALEKMGSMVVKAEYEMAVIEGQARIARQEWDRLEHTSDEPPNPLVFFEPQLRNATAILKSAQADVRLMELNIQRTRVLAPFNCMIKTERLEVGQLIMAGQAVVSLRGTDFAEVIIPVTYDDLNWLSVPRRDGDTGSKATVKLSSKDHSHQWAGSVTRSLGEVDLKARMLRLAVEIPDPYGLEEDDDSNMFLAEGLFVEVELEGHIVEDVFKIPASTLREGSHVWLKNEESVLEIRLVNVLRNEGEFLLVRGQLQTGDSLILTYLQGAVPGLSLRSQEGL